MTIPSNFAEVDLAATGERAETRPAPRATAG